MPRLASKAARTRSFTCTAGPLLSFLKECYPRTYFPTRRVRTRARAIFPRSGEDVGNTHRVRAPSRVAALPRRCTPGGTRPCQRHSTPPGPAPWPGPSPAGTCPTWPSPPSTPGQRPESPAGTRPWAPAERPLRWKTRQTPAAPHQSQQEVDHHRQGAPLAPKRPKAAKTAKVCMVKGTGPTGMVIKRKPPLGPPSGPHRSGTALWYGKKILAWETHLISQKDEVSIPRRLSIVNQSSLFG